MQKDWISADQMHADLKNAGAQISDSQIERWRREGLLTRPKQVGRGRGAGSYILVPANSAAQASEIQRLFNIRRKRDWVGWQLWTKGYAVSDQYWRPALENARSMLFDVRQAAEAFVPDTEGDIATTPSIPKIAVLTALHDTPLYSALARLRPDILETLIGFGIELITGGFSQFSYEDDNEPNSEELSAVMALLGVSAAKQHTVGGKRIDFSGQIETVLLHLSNALGNIRPDKPLREPPIELRREFTQVMEIAIALYQAFLPIFGRKALDLGTINQIANNPAINIQAMLLLGWGELRQVSTEILSPVEIEELHTEAIQMLQLAGQWLAQFNAVSSDEKARMLTAFRKAIAKPNVE